ncbi:hypothetical protein Thpro_022646 [Acidihalobacter prosperus]|uniref:Lipoprotein n=2 Tax=Acidihalobacter prosperus TaxID=160660 RepID=A0A1A6C1F2_9GAMM|nr:hypothetical protein Thpro_022646 [Acidihalobacter prosperus]
MMPFCLRRLLPFACAILLCAALSGCGHKGPLYLPSNQGATQPAAGS